MVKRHVVWLTPAEFYTIYMALLAWQHEHNTAMVQRCIDTIFSGKVCDVASVMKKETDG